MKTCHECEAVEGTPHSLSCISGKRQIGPYTPWEKARDEVDRLNAEITQLKKTQQSLHRRTQQAESNAAKRIYAELWGGNNGRAISRLCTRFGIEWRGLSVNQMEKAVNEYLDKLEES